MFYKANHRAFGKSCIKTDAARGNEFVKLIKLCYIESAEQIMMNIMAKI